MKRAYVKVEISKEGLMQALRDLTINNEDFDHRPWAIWDAEVLERVAAMIREGYQCGAKTVRHPRCELCGDNPPAQPHCWVIEFADEDGGEEGYPRAECRHCPATADVCSECDGEGISQDGEETDCSTCEGWGVIPPGEGQP